MSTSGLKAIAPVPTAADFLDIVLSKTQRKTPTVIHKNFKISRIRNFYMRKLGAILNDFPMLDDIHPFLSSLMNVLYDKNHYKLALGQLRTARHLIDQVAKDYVRLLKSSFINKVTRADVDVQPYAFTTKSLFVGHLDYKYLRWQVIDTPGILDHPLEEMNTIEMQSITALAHLKSCVLYFMDLSEQCGYTVAAQCALFHSIKPLFAGKPTVLVLNKTDEIIDTEDVKCVSGVMDLKTQACDALLAHRVDNKVKGSKISSVINRIHVAQPKPRDDPGARAERKKYDKNDPERRTLQRDIELVEGGAGVYNINLRDNYLLANPEWKMDVMPEIMDGKNIADFIDPDIAEKLEALEREEERLEAEGFYASDEDLEVSEDERERVEARIALSHKIRSQSLKKSKKNQSRLPRSAGLATLSQMTAQLTRAGLDPSRIVERAGVLAGKRKRDDMDGGADAEGWMDVDGEEGDGTPAKRLKTNLGAVTKREPRGNRALAGMRDQGQADRARPRNMLARAGEGDRTIKTKMPKHLFAGKRKGGKTQRR
ncbi:nucleolar GTP-binding protein 1-domain-containing protein [Mycena olivaceomarginata]|nr:nucleolar GTP-binding protein 1-domain-containing protein [Mycena olivaceomarginata]